MITILKGLRARPCCPRAPVRIDHFPRSPGLFLSLQLAGFQLAGRLTWASLALPGRPGWVHT